MKNIMLVTFAVIVLASMRAAADCGYDQNRCLEMCRNRGGVWAGTFTEGETKCACNDQRSVCSEGSTLTSANGTCPMPKCYCYSGSSKNTNATFEMNYHRACCSGDCNDTRNFTDSGTWAYNVPFARSANIQSENRRGGDRPSSPSDTRYRRLVDDCNRAGGRASSVRTGDFGDYGYFSCFICFGNGGGELYRKIYTIQRDTNDSDATVCRYARGY